MRGGESGDEAGERRECGSQEVRSGGKSGLEAAGGSADEARRVKEWTLGQKTKALTRLRHRVGSEYNERGERNIMTHRS